jgi:hypothetical protein
MTSNPDHENRGQAKSYRIGTLCTTLLFCNSIRDIVSAHPLTAVDSITVKTPAGLGRFGFNHQISRFYNSGSVDDIVGK